MKSLGLWVAAGFGLSLTAYWSTHQVAPSSDESKVEHSAGMAKAYSPVVLASTPEIAELAAPGLNETIGERVDLLSRSMRAGDRFRAYKLVARCLMARYFEDLRTNSPVAEASEFDDRLAQYSGACDGVTQAQLDRRMDNLQRAVDAGLRGAAHEFFVAGPFGDLSAVDQRPDDPLVTEWKQKSLLFLEQAASSGDFSAIIDLAQIYEGGPLAARNAESLLMYLVAESEISAQRGHPVRGLDLTPVESGLTPDQVASAVAAGKRLAGWTFDGT